jgi:hypothetical protein
MRQVWHVASPILTVTALYDAEIAAMPGRSVKFRADCRLAQILARLFLDPTCGSGTTTYVAEQWGRRWITIDTSRVALALARTRLMAARFPYYLLADSVDGRKKEFELYGGNANLSEKFNNDIRRGFVYKRVPHVTLKSIASKPDNQTRNDAR